MPLIVIKAQIQESRPAYIAKSPGIPAGGQAPQHAGPELEKAKNQRGMALAASVHLGDSLV